MNRRTFLAQAASAMTLARYARGELAAGSLTSMMKEHLAVGAAFAMTGGGQLTVKDAGGLLRVDAEAPYSTETIQNVASVSKTVTATAAMQLVEQGRIDLDGDINTYLPFGVRHPDHPDIPITLRLLLSHQAAIKDGVSYDSSYACGDPSRSLDAWMRDVFTPAGAHATERRFHAYAPGKSYRYSNVGFGLVGYLVAQVSGRPFSEYCRTAIFAPLGMTSTGWMISEIDITRHALPHVYLKRLPRRRNGGNLDLIAKWPDKAPDFAQFCLYSFPNYPDGLLRTSVVDFSKFLGAFATGGLPLLQPDTFEEMLRPQIKDLDDRGSFQALCWMGRKNEQGNPFYAHSGGDPGVSTLAAFRPADQVSACAFANAETQLPMTLVEAALA